MEYLDEILNIVAALVGFPAFVAALINVLKSRGLPDGTAGKVSAGLHLVAYVGVGVAVLTGRLDLLPGIDLALGAIAEFLLAVLAFLSSMSIARGYHNNVLRGLPVVGKSHKATG